MTNPPRHDAKYSPAVIKILDQLLPSITGLIVDPFAGTGQHLATLDNGRGIYGIEIEPDWAAASTWVHQGDALGRTGYPLDTAAIVTSPCYGNRLADPYLGRPCDHCYQGQQPSGPTGADGYHKCEECNGTGHDPKDQKRRFSYAISLGHPVHKASAASLHFWNDQRGYHYRHFHNTWLRTITHVLTPGPNRLILNMKDHYRQATINGETAQRRQHACNWWVTAASEAGFRLTSAHVADTAGIGFGANMQTGKVDHEMVFVFDLADR